MDEWDRQIELDSAAGKLEKLFEKARVDHANGKSKKLGHGNGPSASRNTRDPRGCAREGSFLSRGDADGAAGGGVGADLDGPGVRRRW
jgi:hypothetical protein